MKKVRLLAQILCYATFLMTCFALITGNIESAGFFFVSFLGSYALDTFIMKVVPTIDDID